MSKNFTEQVLAVRWVPSDPRLHRLLEISCQQLFLLCLSLPVVRPPFLGERNVAPLTLLRSTAQQNDDHFAVFPEVDAVARKVKNLESERGGKRGDLNQWFV